MRSPRTLLALHQPGADLALVEALEAAGLVVQLSTNMAETWNRARSGDLDAIVLAPLTTDAASAEVRSLITLAADPAGPALLILTTEPEFLAEHAGTVDDVLPHDLPAGDLERRVRFAVARRAALQSLHAERETLLQQTITDFKTGLYNDRFFAARCREECSRAQRQEQPLGLIMIDFDDFKGINDQNDHAFGDHVLLWFARTLKSRLRDFDIPARLGGDEFAVLLPNTRLEDAVTIAERIGEAVSGTPIEDRGHRCQLTVSIGAVSWNPEGKRTFDEELKGADRALLDAKKLGRNRICTYDGQVKPHEPGAAAEKGSKKGSLKR